MKEKLEMKEELLLESGTEPLIRVMIETNNQNLSNEILDEVKTSLTL